MIFSILIPTWNNLPYLRLCIESIRKNSAYAHQVLVHVNETNDATEQYLSQQKIEFTHSADNIGICKALNLIAPKAISEHIMYMNDDMYCLPHWDEYLVAEIEKCETEKYMFSATMMEPSDTGNMAAIVADFGHDLNNFEEEALLKNFDSFFHADWSGSSWPPNVVHRSMWEKLGGYNEYFSPGMSSDDDFSMRMWLNGCRLFKGISKSRVYHFQCKSTGRIEKNDGRKQFRSLYGITQNMFNTYYLRKGEVFSGELKGPQPGDIGYWLKKLYHSLRKP